MRAIRYLLLAAVGGLFVEWGWRYVNRPLQKHVKMAPKAGLTVTPGGDGWYVYVPPDELQTAVYVPSSWTGGGCDR